MSDKVLNIIAVLFMVALFGGAYYIDEYVACNKKGSFAAKINWAGHGECKE